MGIEPDGARSVAPAARTLLHEHLLSWLPLYLSRVELLACAPYREWAALLHRVLLTDARRLGNAEPLALHLRAAPKLLDPRVDGHDAFLDGLLSPVRSGFVLTGADLRRAAGELRLGRRIGERRFVLNALLAQHPVAVLRWLAEHTETTVGAWRPWATVLPKTARWWSARALATRRLLLDLVDAPDDVAPDDVAPAQAAR